MNNEFIKNLIFGVATVITWFMVTTGILLFFLGNKLLIVLIFLISGIMWLRIMSMRRKKGFSAIQIDRNQQEKIFNISMGSLLFLSLFIVFVVLNTPDNPTLRDQYYAWKQIIAYGGLIITLFFFIRGKMLRN